MDDEKIVALYWDRNEQAVEETSAKYGSYCGQIARNILDSGPDAEECVNDTWLHAWNAIPPPRPALLAVFLGRITRNLAFDRWRRNRSEKRGGGQIDLVLDELAECVSGADDPAHAVQAQELVKEIDRFLAGLPEDKRAMFLQRYWYADSVRTIARRFAMSENNVSVMLSRLRGKLKTQLHERGYDL